MNTAVWLPERLPTDYMCRWKTAGSDNGQL